jgi:hypothetical protein
MSYAGRLPVYPCMDSAPRSRGDVGQFVSAFCKTWLVSAETFWSLSAADWTGITTLLTAGLFVAAGTLISEIGTCAIGGE